MTVDTTGGNDMKKKRKLTIEQKLKRELPNTPLYHTVIEEIKNELLDEDSMEDWEHILHYVLEYGALSGVIGSLIYKANIEHFAISHLDEITELIEFYNYRVRISKKLLKDMASIGYEIVCSDIYDVLLAIKKRRSA